MRLPDFVLRFRLRTEGLSIAIRTETITNRLLQPVDL
jgi:hypothetical protein